MSKIFTPSTPSHHKLPRDDSSNAKLLVKASTAKIIEEQAINHEKDRSMWEEEKQLVENRLDEALAINSKLFEKVKRMEQ